MFEWLAENGWVGWLALALVLGTVEIATLDLTFLMLAGGALAGTAAALLGLPFFLAAIIAVAGAAALLGLVRPVALRHLQLPHRATSGWASRRWSASRRSSSNGWTSTTAW